MNRQFCVAVAAVAIIFSASTSLFAATLPVTSGLYAWYDASNIDGSNNSTLSNGNTVSSWVDSAPGNAHPLGSPVGAATYATAGLNGKPAVHFSGTGVGLTTTSGFGLGSAAGADVQYTQFVVFTTTNNGTEQHAFWIGSGSSSPGTSANAIAFELQSGSARRLLMAGGFGRNYNTTYVDSSPTNPAFYLNKILAATKPLGNIDANLSVSVDGTAVGNNGSSFAGPNNIKTTDLASVGRPYISANGLSNGDLAEVIFYNRVLDPTELNAVGFYLETKYNLNTAYTIPTPEPSSLFLTGVAGLSLLRPRHRAHRSQVVLN